MPQVAYRNVDDRWLERLRGARGAHRKSLESGRGRC